MATSDEWEEAEKREEAWQFRQQDSQQLQEARQRQGLICQSYRILYVLKEYPQFRNSILELLETLSAHCTHSDECDDSCIVCSEARDVANTTLEEIFERVGTLEECSTSQDDHEESQDEADPWAEDDRLRDQVFDLSLGIMGGISLGPVARS